MTCVYPRTSFRRKPCDTHNIHSPPATSKHTPPTVCKNISASRTTDPSAEPAPCGSSSATLSAVSSLWPQPVPRSGTLPPTAPQTMHFSPPLLNFAELQRRLNRVLQGDLPHALRRRASRLPSTSSPTAANPAPRQCGYRRLDLGRLSFRKMLVWLQHWAEARFGIHDEIATEHLLYE